MELRKKKKFIYWSIVIIAGIAAHYFFGWLIFHKPAFRGKVIDAETKKPIEEAAVVAIYRTHSIIGGPAGGDSSIIHVRETLTDNKGEFDIPSYTTLIQPNSREYRTDFVIYKPGYWSHPNSILYPLVFYSPVELEKHFYSRNIGTKSEKKCRFSWGRNVKAVPITFGEVELLRVNTWEERRQEKMISIRFPKSKWPLLYEMLEKEYKWVRNNKGWKLYDNKSSLISAARVGDINMARTLIEKDIDVNYSLPGCDTAINIATRSFVRSSTKEYLEIVKLLLDAGADINVTSTFGDTPLMMAAKGCKAELAKILLESGADRNIKRGCSTGYCTALDFAKKWRCSEVIKLLQEN